MEYRVLCYRTRKTFGRERKLRSDSDVDMKRKFYPRPELGVEYCAKILAQIFTKLKCIPYEIRVYLYDMFYTEHDLPSIIT